MRVEERSALRCGLRAYLWPRCRCCCHLAEGSLRVCMCHSWFVLRSPQQPHWYSALLLSPSHCHCIHTHTCTDTNRYRAGTHELSQNNNINKLLTKLLAIGSFGLHKWSKNWQWLYVMLDWAYYPKRLFTASTYILHHSCYILTVPKPLTPKCWVSCYTDWQAFSPCFLGAVGAVWLALGGVRGVGLRVVYRGGWGGGGGRGGGGRAGVFEAAAAGGGVSLWFVGGSHPVTAGRAVCSWGWVMVVRWKENKDACYLRWLWIIVFGGCCEAFPSSGFCIRLFLHSYLQCAGVCCLLRGGGWGWVSRSNCPGTWGSEYPSSELHCLYRSPSPQTDDTYSAEHTGGYSWEFTHLNQKKYHSKSHFHNRQSILSFKIIYSCTMSVPHLKMPAYFNMNSRLGLCSNRPG